MRMQRTPGPSLAGAAEPAVRYADRSKALAVIGGVSASSHEGRGSRSAARACRMGVESHREVATANSGIRQSQVSLRLQARAVQRFPGVH